MQVVASEELGELASGEIPPVRYLWKWHYCLPSLTLAALIVLFVFFWRESHVRHSWQTVMLAVAALVLLQMEGFSLLLASVIGVWTVVWLLRGWFPGRKLGAEEATYVMPLAED